MDGARNNNSEWGRSDKRHMFSLISHHRIVALNLQMCVCLNGHQENSEKQTGTGAQVSTEANSKTDGLKCEGGRSWKKGLGGMENEKQGSGWVLGKKNRKELLKIRET